MGVVKARTPQPNCISLRLSRGSVTLALPGGSSYGPCRHQTDDDQRDQKGRVNCRFTTWSNDYLMSSPKAAALR
jgi:hypothetical protein